MTAESLRQKLMDELSSYDVNMPEYYEFRQKIIHTLIDILCEQRHALEFYAQKTNLYGEKASQYNSDRENYRILEDKGETSRIALAAGDEKLRAMGVEI